MTLTFVTGNQSTFLSREPARFLALNYSVLNNRLRSNKFHYYAEFCCLRLSADRRHVRKPYDG
jgi:hypothetical protein